MASPVGAAEHEAAPPRPGARPGADDGQVDRDHREDARRQIESQAADEDQGDDRDRPAPLEPAPLRLPRLGALDEPEELVDVRVAGGTEQLELRQPLEAGRPVRGRFPCRPRVRSRASPAGPGPGRFPDVGGNAGGRAGGSVRGERGEGERVEQPGGGGPRQLARRAGPPSRRSAPARAWGGSTSGRRTPGSAASPRRDTCPARGRRTAGARRRRRSARRTRREAARLPAARAAPAWARPGRRAPCPRAAPG